MWLHYETSFRSLITPSAAFTAKGRYQMRQWREFSGFDLIFWNWAISHSHHLLIQIISSHFSQLNWVAVCMLMGQVSGELCLLLPDNGWEPFVQRHAVPLEALRFARIYYIFPRLLHSRWLISHAQMAFSRTEWGVGGTKGEPQKTNFLSACCDRNAQLQTAFCNMPV